ncbi:MAG: hypothetical protein HQM10_05715 [Candidatus Riflebacteria bacterium]|nr:hypothetical protein [Candidatus Riflebacteria bacterium]
MKSKSCIVIIFLSAVILLSGSFLPVSAKGTNQEASELMKQAEEAFKANDLEKASKLMLEAIKKEPDNAVFRYVFAQILTRLEDYLQAKENFEIVARSRPSTEKGEEYNQKLKDYKKKVKNLQEKFNQKGEEKFNTYLKNQDSKQRLKLAVTLFQAFRLNPTLRYKNYEELKQAMKIYEEALQSSLQGKDWNKEPMLQLAFLYESSNLKDKAAEVYMRALDYIADSNEEFIITHKFDYLNRSSKDKLLDTIEAGEFTQKDLEELIGSQTEKLGTEEKEKIDSMITEARDKLENATTQEEREEVLEEIKKNLLEKQKRGELPGQEKLNEKLKKEGKTMEDYMKEKGF